MPFSGQQKAQHAGRKLQHYTDRTCLIQPIVFLLVLHGEEGGVRGSPLGLPTSRWNLEFSENYCSSRLQEFVPVRVSELQMGTGVLPESRHLIFNRVTLVDT